MKKNLQKSRNTRLLKQIKHHRLYRTSNRRDEKSRNILESELPFSKKGDIHQGQLLLFNYFTPITEEELEYYDASPCAIFFGIFNTEKGRRVIGFNIHYFPPRIRYRIINLIYQLFQRTYNKYFETGLSKDIKRFTYQEVTSTLSRYNLGWAVRMYDPKLMGSVRVIPPDHWPTAVFTEGWFKKETRERIMQLFKQNSIQKNKVHSIRSAGQSSKRR